MSAETPSRRRVAAFFDLDGTLVAFPSIELRFFRTLRYQRKIRFVNYALWCAEALRLLPRGLAFVGHANKMYLRGINTWVSAHSPIFLKAAMERLIWHVKQGHAIVLVSGTLEPLAREAAQAVAAELISCRAAAAVQVCATRLEERNGQWTGKILGPPMFGEEKARAAQRCAREMNLDLSRSYAYGDSASDRWMLGAVGRPAAVNASRELLRVANMHGWPVLDWREKDSAHRHESAEPAQHAHRKISWSDE